MSLHLFLHYPKLVLQVGLVNLGRGKSKGECPWVPELVSFLRVLLDATLQCLSSNRLGLLIINGLENVSPSGHWGWGRDDRIPRASGKTVV